MATILTPIKQPQLSRHDFTLDASSTRQWDSLWVTKIFDLKPVLKGPVHELYMYDVYSLRNFYLIQSEHYKIETVLLSFLLPKSWQRAVKVERLSIDNSMANILSNELMHKIIVNMVCVWKSRDKDDKPEERIRMWKIYRRQFSVQDLGSGGLFIRIFHVSRSTRKRKSGCKSREQRIVYFAVVQHLPTSRELSTKGMTGRQYFANRKETCACICL